MPLIDPISMASSLAPKARKPTDSKPPQSPPMPVLDTPLVRLVSLATPPLLLSVFAAAFPSLVQDPVHTMRTITLPAASLATLVATIACLPPAGAEAARKKKPRPGEKRKDEAGVNWAVTALLAIALTAFSIPLLHATLILFGAPVLTHVPHTLLLAAHLAVLGLFPVFYVDGVALRAFGSGNAALDLGYAGVVGTFVGAWLGAVPIPLDWDRPWQVWPIPVLVGTFGGWALGRVGGIVRDGWIVGRGR